MRKRGLWAGILMLLPTLGGCCSETRAEAQLPAWRPEDPRAELLHKITLWRDVPRRWLENGQAVEWRSAELLEQGLLDGQPLERRSMVQRGCVILQPGDDQALLRALRDWITYAEALEELLGGRPETDAKPIGDGR